MMDSYYFYIKITDAYLFKILVDILHGSLKDLCFDLSDHGVKIIMMDSRKQILFDTQLSRDDFQPYVYAFPEQHKQIGINAKHLHAMVHTIRRKDILVLYIKKTDHYKMYIDIMPKDMNKITHSQISISNHQNISVSAIPQGYTSFMIVSSQDYQKMIKELCCINSKIFVKASASHIEFSADMPQVFNKSIVFGKYDPTLQNHFEGEFSSEYLLKVVKLSGLNKNIKIYTQKDSPLFMCVRLFDACWFNVYIKTEPVLMSPVIINSSAI